MTDIGRFRTVDVRDLARFVYGGNEARLKYDLRKPARARIDRGKDAFPGTQTVRGSSSR